METQSESGMFEIPSHIEDAPEIFHQLNEKEQEMFFKLTQERLQEYKEIFDIFDETGDGSISGEEIGKVMIGLGEDATEEKIAKLVSEIDYDGNNEVDF